MKLVNSNPSMLFTHVNSFLVRGWLLGRLFTESRRVLFWHVTTYCAQMVRPKPVLKFVFGPVSDQPIPRVDEIEE